MQPRFFKQLLIAGFVLCLLPFYGAQAQEAAGEVQIRFANFVDGSTGIKLTKNDANGKIFAELEVPAAPGISDYSTFPAPSSAYSLRQPGSGIHFNSFSTLANHRYLVVITGIPGQSYVLSAVDETQLFGDDKAAAADMARLIFVQGQYLKKGAPAEYSRLSLNAEGGAFKVALTIARVPAFSGFSSDRGPRGFEGLQVTPGKYQLDAASYSALDKVLDTASLTLEANNTYLVVLAGTLEKPHLIVAAGNKVIVPKP